MANIIKLKQSNQGGKIPLVSDLVLGEPALNTTDGRLYIKQSVGGVESIVDIGNNQAIADLTSDLADEITNRIADVDAEEARAGAAELALDVRVTAIESYDKETVYVDSVNGVDAVGRGSLVKPFKTINYAYSQVPSVVGATDLDKVTQFVSEKLVFELAPGAYTENVTVGFKRARVAIVGNGARIIGNVKCQVLKSSFPVASLESYKAQLPAPWTGSSAQMCFEIAGEAGGGLEGDATASIVTVTGSTSLEFENGGANYNWDTQYGQFYSYFDNVNLVGGFNLVHDNTVTTARAPACVVEIESSKVGSGDTATRSYLGFVPFGAATTVPAYGGLTLKTHNSTIASVLGPTITIGEMDGCRIYDIDRTMGGIVTNGSVNGSTSTSYIGIVNTQFRAFSGAAGASVYKVGATAGNAAYKIDSVSHGTLTNGRTLDIAAGRTVTYTLLDRAAGVVVVPAGNLASTTVQAALEELQGDVNTINTSLASKADASALTSETNARIAADGVLQSAIDAVEGDVTALVAEDLTLLKKDGSRALTGELSAGGNKITNLFAPSANGDAANKEYVDDSVSGIAGDLSALQSGLAQAEGDIAALETSVSGLDGRVATAEGSITTLQGDLSSAQISVTALQNYKDEQTVYVAKNGDDATANGGEHKPYATLSAAMAAISDASATKRYIIKVKAGTYTQATALNLKANVFIVGEARDAVRISASSFGLDSSFSGSADNRSGMLNLIVTAGNCDFNWATATSAAGKLYFTDVSFSPSVSLYGHNNATAQAQFHNCTFFSTFTVSGINVGIHRNNIHYGNITLNQHPNGGMATILVADGGTCSGTLSAVTTVNDFNRRCAIFARSFYCEYLTINGPSSYCDATDNSLPRDAGRITKSNGASFSYINTTAPIDSSTRNMGDVGRQYLYNFNYVNASTGSDLYVISMGTSYAADSTGRSIFIESDSYGLNSDVSGGDINIATATTSGTGVRGKIKLSAQMVDADTAKIVNLADGVSSSDAVNKGQLDFAVSDLDGGLF
jgi:hypothetical protein